MTLEIKSTNTTIKVDQRSFEYHIIIPNEIMPQFKALIARGLNTFDTAHPALKELGDILYHNRVLQDYYAQRSDKPLRSPKG